MNSETKVTIYRPRSSVNTQGSCSGKKWIIKFECDSSKFTYDLMKWTGSKDMSSELKLTFETKEQAIEFANKKKWSYQIQDDYTKKIIKKNYAENFK